MNKQYAEHIAKTNPTRYRMTCDMGGESFTVFILCEQNK